MRMILGLLIVICLLPVWAAADRVLDAGIIEFEQDKSVVISTHDDRELIYLVDRPKVDAKLPILMLIDGSGCVGQSRPDIGDFYRPVAIRTSLQSYARIRVEKPGVGHSDDWSDEGCSEDFLKHYTIDKRVEDHLRVLQHLRASADWWNGELYIFGWSDGGDIGVRLNAYYPQVTRAVLGGMGGGINMATHFEDDWICGEATQVGDREACVESVRANFRRMANNPTWKQSWSGDDNSWRVWASRLWSRTTNLLRDNSNPVLIVHGADDFESMPVSSARKLVEDLEAAGNTAFTYWEIVGMKHTIRSLPPEQNKILETAMLYWLLKGKVDQVQSSVLEPLLSQTSKH